MISNLINFEVNKEDSDLRLDVFLNEKIEYLSRSRIKKLIETKKVKINNDISISCSKKLKEGDVVKISIIDTTEESILAKNIKINIIFEDNDILIVNKPNGLTVHPGAGNKDNTLVNGLIYLYKDSLSDVNGKVRPGIVHRLDKDTSGLLVIAKNNEAHFKLAKQFITREIKREYVALVWGKLRPQHGRIETLLTRSKKNRKMMEIGFTKGKKAVTNYKTLEVFENEKSPTFSLIECRLETGRTHQIRVHMSYKGNNILGDKTYKKKFKSIKNVNDELVFLIKNINRQFLHAKLIGLRHPTSGKYLEFKTNLPNDLNNILKKLRKMQN